MRAFIFRRPTTGQNVQGPLGDDRGTGQRSAPIRGRAVPRVPIVNPLAGKLLSEEIED
jgi:hypothetical protein